MRTPYRVLETGNTVKLVLLRMGRQQAVRQQVAAQEVAAERLREFTSDWSEPEKLIVEDVIVGRATQGETFFERRKAPGRPQKGVAA